MATILNHRITRRLLVISALAVLATVAIVPLAASQEADTLTLDVIMAGESFERVAAIGNESSDAFLARGDVLSAQGSVYAAGDAGGERLGTFYFMSVGTAEPEHFDTAANHLNVVAYFELFDRGTLALAGVASFTSSSTVAITGGTGNYASASGQCTTVTIEDIDHWECEIH